MDSVNNIEVIQIITNEWIDLIKLDLLNKIAIRTTNNDEGTFLLDDIDNKILKIQWNIWGLEKFEKINNIYYNCKDNLFEIQIDSDEWCDIGIFNINNNIVNKKYKNNDIGIYKFINNILYIEWNNDGLQKYNQLNYGKIYSNTNFGKILNNNSKKEIKIIAIVFPQFHEIIENNKFWGKGFTEWTLLKNIPRIVNNEIIKQPHDDIGYFNLKDYSHRNYMKVLANKYNIYGFCYYHYWFKNKKVMYEPTELILFDNEPNKKFLFCWANEQWTKRWDGGNNEILLEQDYSDIEGNIEHFYYLLQFFKHKNYMKKYNKPIFIFYRIEEKDIEQIRIIIKLWNELSIKEGYDGIHFMRFLGPFNNNICMEEINGYIEFEPGYCTSTFFNDIISEDDNKIFDEYNEELYLLKNNDIKELVEKNIISCGKEHYDNININEKNFRTSKFNVFDGIKLYENILKIDKKYDEQHRGISVNWNNTPRRNYNNDEYDKYPHYYKNINYNNFGDCFYKLLEKVDNNKNKDDDYIFISAWNEWNEQAILEPNNEDGYSYLKKISDKYLEFYDFPKKKHILNICHLGGGTEKYMNDLKNIFLEYNFIDFKSFDISINYSDLYKNIDIIHINSILFNNLKNNYIYFLETYFEKTKKILTIHDYQWIFPDNPNIYKENYELYFNNDINNENQNNNKLNSLKLFNKLLEICNIIIFPSNNIYENYKNYINLEKYDSYGNKIFIVNHCDKIINYNFFVIPRIIYEINIGYIGYFVDYKGSEILKNIAKLHKNYNGIRINYHIYGNINKHENNEDNIIYHYTYKDNEIINKLHNDNIHGIVHLSLFEESYCYALTNSINSGLPIFYLNRGSFKERLSNKSDKYISTELKDINDNFIKFIEYLIKNNNKNNYYELNKEIQPNKWYLENYV
jgi:hypothetical protein